MHQGNTILVSLPKYIIRRLDCANIVVAKMFTPGASAIGLDFDSQYQNMDKVFTLQPATPPGRLLYKPIRNCLKNGWI